MSSCAYRFFFFNDTATTEIYTLSLHDALPIFLSLQRGGGIDVTLAGGSVFPLEAERVIVYCRAYHRLWRVFTCVTIGDRKSTRLNSSHANISYAVFCLKKKKVLSGESRVYVYQ